MHCPHYGYWASLSHLRAAYPNIPGRQLLGMVANGHASICKPRTYAHQRAALNEQGRWIVKLVDEVTPLKRQRLYRPAFRLSTKPSCVDYTKPARRFAPAKPAPRRVRTMRPNSVNTLTHLLGDDK